MSLPRSPAPLGSLVGSRLGNYEIVSLLGSGAMGEVYRARDTRLGRDVALKILPTELTANPERRQRFEREARAASSLNHPAIVTVYETGTVDSVTYIAMELIEGETLDVLLARGEFSPRRLLDLAIPLAEGLARAHEAGVVHRDLKPENLMVTKTGQPKILDFGLARQLPFEGGFGTDRSTLGTGTEAGTILGTVGYMSPEQASGLPADHRSDQFSFGAILYEMATGRRAFEGKTKVETLSAVVRDEPQPIETINPKAPPPLRWIIERCLSKDPKDRYASTQDLARDLSSLREHLSEVSGSGGAALAGGASPWRWLRGTTLVSVCLAIGLGVLIFGRHGGPGEPPSYSQLTFRRGYVESARFSPDEETIVYAAVWQNGPLEIFMHRLGSPESRPFGLSGANLLSISRSGEIALLLKPWHPGMFQAGTLARMGMVSSGAPREILENANYADWSPDGRELAVIREVGGRSTLEYPIGRVLDREMAGYLSFIRVSRKGDEVAFIEHPTRSEENGSVAVVDRSGRKRVLATGFSTIKGVGWSPDGGEVWFTAASSGINRALYAVSLSGHQRLLARVMGSMILQDVAPSGRVLLTHEKDTEHVMALPPGEQRERDLTWLDFSLSRAISDDGRTVLLLESGEGGGPGSSVFLRKTDGSAAVRLGDGTPWALSPDGKWAAAFVEKAGVSSLALYPTGAGEVRSIPLQGLEPQSADWLPDGRRILITAGEAGHPSRLYLQSVTGGRPQAVSPDGYRDFEGTVSPNGTLVVVEGPDRKIFLYPIEGGTPTPLPALTLADVPRGWTADGRYLYVTGNVYTIPRAVDRFDVRTGKREPWKELGPETGAVGIHVTPDGRSYVYSYVQNQGDLYLAEGLR